MTKLSKKQLAHFKQFDREAFTFSNAEIQRFFDNAVAQGYNLDTTGFLAHPGFFQAPHKKDISSVDIVMLGSPLDLGAIGLSGARHGPQALREASRNYGPANDITGNIPFLQCSLADYGDVEWSATDLQTRLEDIYRTVSDIVRHDCFILNCGGEHTTSFGVLKALSEYHNESFGLVHIDAHSDTMASWGGDRINDGSVFRQAVLNGFIDPARTVQIGIRGRSHFLWEFSHDVGMTVITTDEVFDKGANYVIDRCIEVVGKEKAYFSLDVDGIDSSHMMGTTGPEPFGLLPRQVREIIHGVRGLSFIGADLVELNPNRDPNGYSAHLAAALFFELLCLLANCRVASSGSCQPTNWS